MLARAFCQRKGCFKIGRVQIIKENATHTTRFIAVLQIKVLITPCFKTGIVILTKWVKACLANGMEMDDVFMERVVGCQIHTASKPPQVFIFTMGNKQAHIHVHRWHVRVSWV
jgi:hypothetical protein